VSCVVSPANSLCAFLLVCVGTPHCGCPAFPCFPRRPSTSGLFHACNPYLDAAQVPLRIAAAFSFRICRPGRKSRLFFSSSKFPVLMRKNPGARSRASNKGLRPPGDFACYFRRLDSVVWKRANDFRLPCANYQHAERNFAVCHPELTWARRFYIQVQNKQKKPQLACQ